MSHLNTNPDSPEPEGPSSSKTPGWPLWVWALAFAIALIVALSPGTAVKSRADQQFLYVVIVLQALVGVFIVRVLFAIFRWNSTLGFIGKLFAVALLCSVLFLLTVCSSMSRTGWLGA